MVMKKRKTLKMKGPKRKKDDKKFIQDAIKRPGALTKAVGGPPGKNIDKVRKLAESGSPLKKRQAQFYLNVLRPASKRRKGK